MSADATKMFPAFQMNLFSNANSFVNCWSSRYNYPNYKDYKSIITKPSFLKDDIQLLFNWKNGMKLSTKKEVSFLTKILQHADQVNELKKELDDNLFEKTFGNVSAVWQVFLLHIIQPSQYPIFDQHVYRAFRFIQNQDEKSLPTTKEAKMKIYYEEYLPFFLDMQDLADEYDHFEIDRALWTFGKLIKQHPGLVNMNN